MDTEMWKMLRVTYRQFKVVAEEELEKATAGTWQVICQLGEPISGAQASAGAMGSGGPLWFMPRADRARFLLGRGEADTLAEKDEKIKLLEGHLAKLNKDLADLNERVGRVRRSLLSLGGKPSHVTLVAVVAEVSNALKVST